MRVYYAHCMAIYETPQEARDIALLTRMGLSVTNPAEAEYERRCQVIRETFGDGTGHPYYSMFTSAGEAIMRLVFQPLVDACDMLAFRALPGGAIPAGVAKEIDWAGDKPIIELPNFSMRLHLSVTDTKRYLAEIGQR